MLGQCRRSVVFVISGQELVGVCRKMLTKPVVKPIVAADYVRLPEERDTSSGKERMLG
jgi:hypothetical protein